MNTLKRSAYQTPGGPTAAVKRWNAAAQATHGPNPDRDLAAEEQLADAQLARLRHRLKTAAPSATRGIVAQMAGIQTQLGNIRAERESRRQQRATEHTQDLETLPPPRIPDLPRTFAARGHRVS